MITAGTEIKHDTAPFGTAELLAESNRRDRHPAGKTSLSRQALDSRCHSCEDHLTLVARSSSQEEHQPTKNPGCSNNRGFFSRDPTRPAPFSEPQQSRPASIRQ
jgi:hypothetical protein